MSQTTQVRGVATNVFTDANGDLCVMYHGTVVWRRRLDGSITLHTDGWKTATTKLRMNQAFNQFGPAYYFVYQKAGSWFVGIRGTDKVLAFDDTSIDLPRIIDRVAA